MRSQATVGDPARSLKGPRHVPEGCSWGHGRLRGKPPEARVIGPLQQGWPWRCPAQARQQDSPARGAWGPDQAVPTPDIFLAFPLGQRLTARCLGRLPACEPQRHLVLVLPARALLGKLAKAGQWPRDPDSEDHEEAGIPPQGREGSLAAGNADLPVGERKRRGRGRLEGGRLQ